MWGKLVNQVDFGKGFRGYQKLVPKFEIVHYVQTIGSWYLCQNLSKSRCWCIFVLLLSHRQPNRHKYAKMNQTSWCKSKNARKVPNSISSSILLSSCTFGYIPSTWINTRLIHSKPQLWLESKTLVAAMMLLLCIYYLACS